MSPGRVLVVGPPSLADGYRLAGVSVVEAATAAEATSAVRAALAGERGVVAVHEPYWSALPLPLRSDLETRLVPLVVPLPAPDAGGLTDRRSAALRSMVAAAVGFELTFDVQGGPS